MQDNSSVKYVYSTHMFQDSQLPISRTYITDNLLTSIAKRHGYNGDAISESVYMTPGMEADMLTFNDVCVTHIMSKEIESVSVLVENALQEVFVVTSKRLAQDEDDSWLGALWTRTPNQEEGARAQDG